MTRERVNSSLLRSVSSALASSKLFSDMKFCNFLLWLKMVPIISFISYSLLVVGVGFGEVGLMV